MSGLEGTLRRLAAADGVTVWAGGGGWFEVLLTAPPGKRWEPGLHELVVTGFPGESAGLVWARALVRYGEAGLEACDEPGCEWCGR